MTILLGKKEEKTCIRKKKRFAKEDFPPPTDKQINECNCDRHLASQ